MDSADIWRSARLMVRHHGNDAREAASRRRDELLQLGDLTGSLTWRLIGLAIDELLRLERVPGEAIN